MLTFTEYVEGLLSADRAPRRWLPRINATPFTNARRKRMAGNKISKPDWFAPTVREVVPRRWVARMP
jgi:hypothetical protein